jgi:cation transport ATPase
VGAGRGAQLGVLFRTGAALERCSALDLVVFDKTGTLTTGRPEVVAVEPAVGAHGLGAAATNAAIGSTGSGGDRAPFPAVMPVSQPEGDALLALAAAVERSSEHPFARAIVAAAQAIAIVAKRMSASCSDPNQWTTRQNEEFFLRSSTSRFRSSAVKIHAPRLRRLSETKCQVCSTKTA